MIKSILKSGGATLNKKSEPVEFKTGYQVSKKDIMVIPFKELKDSIILKLVTTLRGKKEHLGLWVNKDKVYIDISERVKTKKEAIKLGTEYNQISIFAWNKKECITL